MNDCIGKAVLKVNEKNTAIAQKTGSVNVLSTAVLLGLMEEACVNALSTVCLVCDQNTVGHHISVNHIKQSPIGATVTAFAKIKDVGYKGVQFEIEAFDETGLVGTAKHSRVFVRQHEYEMRCYDQFLRKTFEQKINQKKDI